METLWFCLVAAMITAFVVLDGLDIGAGIVHLIVARTADERALILRSIGPVWDGNEVWLIAGGGTLYFAFPGLYASSFSGFYLPLMMVLWLLIWRGVSIEFRNHVDSPVWTPLWDAGFCGSSALLAVFFGAALGNVVRGVPLDPSGEFFLPLWTSFAIGANPGILDWYTILIAVGGLVVLALHGALWVAHKTEGELGARARQTADLVWWTALVCVAVITLVSFRIQPHLKESFVARPWGAIFPLFAILGLIGIKTQRELAAFLASCLLITGMLTSVAFGLYPLVLPSSLDPLLSLTIHNSAASPYGLRAGLIWFIPGILLATGYFVYVYRQFSGKVQTEPRP